MTFPLFTGEGLDRPDGRDGGLKLVSCGINRGFTKDCCVNGQGRDILGSESAAPDTHMGMTEGVPLGWYCKTPRPLPSASSGHFCACKKGSPSTFLFLLSRIPASAIDTGDVCSQLDGSLDPAQPSGSGMLECCFPNALVLTILANECYSVRATRARPWVLVDISHGLWVACDALCIHLMCLDLDSCAFTNRSMLVVLGVFMVLSSVQLPVTTAYACSAWRYCNDSKFDNAKLSSSGLSAVETRHNGLFAGGVNFSGKSVAGGATLQLQNIVLTLVRVYHEMGVKAIVVSMPSKIPPSIVPFGATELAGPAPGMATDSLLLGQMAILSVVIARDFPGSSAADSAAFSSNMYLECKLAEDGVPSSGVEKCKKGSEGSRKRGNVGCAGFVMRKKLKANRREGASRCRLLPGERSVAVLNLSTTSFRRGFERPSMVSASGIS
ncbi:hypothetical protein KCU88_g163, partial [Aureobasidium melanogenum]